MTGLTDLVKKQIEDNQEIGKFSKTEKTTGGKSKTVFKINSRYKPAQQLITQLGGPKEAKHSQLLTPAKGIKTSGNLDITLTGFDEKSKLRITGATIDALLASSKIYINTAIFPAGYYKKVISEQLKTKKDLPKENNGVDWENLAVGLCHAQHIQLLVGTKTSPKGKTAHAVVLPDGSEINAETPSLVLLSSPRLDLRAKHSKKLHTEEEQIKFIAGMYRNLFQAAVSENRKYILMPAAGLGGHGGTPKLYFKTLMAVAKEYPDLNIIYNAGEHQEEFEAARDTAFKGEDFKNGVKPINVALTTKNIVFAAAYLNANNMPCALHNPSSSNVVYGLSDVGEHWQSASQSILENLFQKNPGKTLQAYLGITSTAVLGSYGINPEAYNRVVENELGTALTLDDSRRSSIEESPHHSESKESKGSKKASTSHQSNGSAQKSSGSDTTAPNDDTKKTSNSMPKLPPEPSQVKDSVEKKAEDSPPKVPTTTDKPASTTPKDSGKKNSNSVPELPPEPSQVKEKVEKKVENKSSPKASTGKDKPIPEGPKAPSHHSDSPLENPKKTSGPGSSGIFSPKPRPDNKPSEPKKGPSAFDEQQLQKINKTIDQLTREIQSFWPYPNKDIKQIKVNALNQLLIDAQSMTILDAIAKSKTDPRVTQGRISTRTADLLDELENAAKPKNVIEV